MTSICFRSMYNKTIIRFGFCDIQNNQGRGKGYHQPNLKAEAGNPYREVDYSGYHKKPSSNIVIVYYLTCLMNYEQVAMPDSGDPF